MYPAEQGQDATEEDFATALAAAEPAVGLLIAAQDRLIAAAQASSAIVPIRCKPNDRVTYDADDTVAHGG